LAVTVLSGLAKEARANSEVLPVFRASLKLMGIKLSKPANLDADNSARLDLMDKVDPLIEERNAARVRKDWKESDRIRDELKAMGVVIKDNKDGTTTWEVAR
jgi:cysteinyl-tRNA synthetase